jgi:hypothetical protein
MKASRSARQQRAVPRERARPTRAAPGLRDIPLAVDTHLHTLRPPYGARRRATGKRGSMVRPGRIGDRHAALFYAARRRARRHLRAFFARGTGDPVGHRLFRVATTTRREQRVSALVLAADDGSGVPPASGTLREGTTAHPGAADRSLDQPRRRSDRSHPYASLNSSCDRLTFIDRFRCRIAGLPQLLRVDRNAHQSPNRRKPGLLRVCILLRCASSRARR